MWCGLEKGRREGGGGGGVGDAEENWYISSIIIYVSAEPQIE